MSGIAGHYPCGTGWDLLPPLTGWADVGLGVNPTRSPWHFIASAAGAHRAAGHGRIAVRAVRCRALVHAQAATLNNVELVAFVALQVDKRREEAVEGVGRQTWSKTGTEKRGKPSRI